MQPRQLIGIALVFVLQQALPTSFAWAADEGSEDPACQNQLSAPDSSGEMKNVQENQGPIRLLGAVDVAGNRAMEWFKDDTGRMVLGTLGEDGKVAAVDPDAENHPQPIDLSPESLLDLGNSIRVRIMPVGSVNPEGNEFAMSGPADETKTHTTDDGRRLLSIVASNRLVVVDVNGQSSQPIFQRSLIEDTDVQWQIDDAGDSAVIYRNGADLVIAYPETTRADFVQPVPADSTVRTIRTSSGEILILVSSPTYSDQVFSYRGQKLVHRATMSAASMKGLVEGADGEIYLAYTQAEPANELIFAKLSQMYTPVLSVPLADGEDLADFTATKSSGGRGLVALASPFRIYVLELVQ